MKHKHFNQRGSIDPLFVIALLLVIGLGIFIYIKVTSASETASESSTNDYSLPDQEKSEEDEDLESYKTEEYGFSFSYPKTWNKIEDINESDNSYERLSVVFETPDKNSMYFKTDLGGKGGVCIPKDSDIPHDLDNECPTEEFLSVETLDLTIPADPKYAEDESNDVTNMGERAKILLVDRKFTSDKTIYQVCLITDFHGDIELNKPSMGFILETFPIPVTTYTVENGDDTFYYIYSCMNSEDEKFLESEDAEAARRVLRSLKFSSPIP